MTTSIIADDYPRTPDLRILAVLAGIAASHGKLWCFPWHRTILAILRDRYGRKMTKRTLCRHLGALERDNHIERKGRHKHGAGGKLELHSTIYVLKAAAVRALARVGDFLRVAAAHPWAKRWFPAVPKTALSTPPQGDFTTDPGDNPPPGSQKSIERLRLMMQTWPNQPRRR